MVAYRFVATSCYTTYFTHNNEDATYQEKFVDVNFSILVDVNFTENLMKLVLGYFLSSFLSNTSPYTIWFYEQYDYTGWAKKWGHRLMTIILSDLDRLKNYWKIPW